MKSKHSFFGGALAVALVTSAVVATSASALTYSVNQTIGGGSVTGFITTDGALGVLAQSDITGWNLDLNGVAATFNINDGNSVVLVVGADLTATATNLLFNFSGGDNGYLLFQDGLFSGTHYYCDATSSGTCLQGATVTPQSIFDPSTQNVAVEGEQIIGTIAGGVPEPAAWAMMLMGLGGLGAVLRAQRRFRRDPTALPA